VAKERRRSLSLGGQEARGLFDRLHADAKLKEVGAANRTLGVCVCLE
jgi:hypothetical protein